MLATFFLVNIMKQLLTKVSEKLSVAQKPDPILGRIFHLLLHVSFSLKQT